jgi:YD repeat-containing protein
MEDVLNYYSFSSVFVLLEVEILGKIETNGDKSVTDKLKVLRIIPFEEYTDSMKSQITIFEYDERDNLISKTYPNGDKYTYEYDERDNKISETYPNGAKSSYENAVITEE